MNITEKKSIVDNLHERFSRTSIAILTDYKGLNVEAMSALRKKLREAGAEYQVSKNSLMRRASENTSVSMIKDHFKGPNAIALSYSEPVEIAKVLTEFARSNEKFEIKIGVLNGKVIEVNDINALSSLPSREVLLGQVLSVMNGVPTALVRALNDLPVRFLNVLNALKDKKESN